MDDHKHYFSKWKLQIAIRNNDKKVSFTSYISPVAIQVNDDGTSSKLNYSPKLNSQMIETNAKSKFLIQDDAQIHVGK